MNDDSDPTLTADTSASLRPFFSPSSVAVIGASRDLASIGGRLLDSVLIHVPGDAVSFGGFLEAAVDERE